MLRARCSRAGVAIVSMVALIMVTVVPARATVPGEDGLIAFVYGDDIHVMESDGSGRVNLTSHPAVDSSPDWSPDGQWISFVSDRSGSVAIYVMSAGGAGLRLVGPGTEPAWSPDGRWIAFAHEDAIWVMDVGGGARRRLTDPASDFVSLPGGERYPGRLDRTPFWSPDGTRIAFNRLYGGYDRRLYSIPVSGGSPTWIRDMSDEWFFDWSPDGTRLVGTWASLSQGGFMSKQVQIVTADGRDRLFLPKLSGALDTPGWSPSGDRLVAAFYPWAQPPATIVTMNVDGTAVTYLPEGTEPDWQALNPYPVVLPFDDISGSIFTDDILWLAREGITRGCNPPATLFCPDDPVTRGQKAAFLNRALRLPAPAEGDPFVDDAGIFEADIEALAAAGITRGCTPDGKSFCPDDPVTRGQMAAFLHRALADR